MIDRRTLLRAGMALAAIPAAQAAQAVVPAPDTGETFPLWPGQVPGSAGVTVEQKVIERAPNSPVHDPAVLHVRTPTLTLFRPDKPNGAALLMIPGGGYQRVVVGKEGYEIARWFNERGFTVFVLLYRLPADGWAAGPDAPLQDAQRAMRLIRSGATQYGIDPQRVGVMGFSAGGHLAGRLATVFERKTYAPVDAADQVSARPDLAALGYPVITMTEPYTHMGSRNELLGRSPTAAQIAEWSVEQHVPADAPPTFLLAATDDPAVPVDNSMMMYLALHHQRVPAAMHIFEKGGHGFGLRTNGAPIGAWPQLMLDWSRLHHFTG
ncbi:alpha/beta hydrolase [Solimonas sp. C16B3]|uniref:Alpha/beta hydrolase n=2 Tax=Solimonas marina TaxID=2714601 RepID=A0A970B654_9GAMM|nr:alpha/beta hydrolase [Solimonas marina]